MDNRSKSNPNLFSNTVMPGLLIKFPTITKLLYEGDSFSAKQKHVPNCQHKDDIQTRSARRCAYSSEYFSTGGAAVRRASDENMYDGDKPSSKSIQKCIKIIIYRG